MNNIYIVINYYDDNKSCKISRVFPTEFIKSLNSFLKNIQCSLSIQSHTA